MPGATREVEAPARLFAQVRSTAGFGVLRTGLTRLRWLRTQLLRAIEWMGLNIFDEDHSHQGCD